MTIDKQKLKALAEQVSDKDSWYTEKTVLAMPESDVDADFIFATSPSVVLALLAEIEQLEAQVRLAGVAAEVTVHKEVGRAVTRELALAHERDQLKAENEALRKDAARWAFFKDLSCQIQAFPHSWGQMTPEKMDFMCDEAMAKESE